MELKSAILASRAFLREGETGQALQTILPALENEPRHASTLRTLQVLEANYNAARQKEIKNILSFLEAQRIYSQVNDALLSTLADLDSGRTPARPANRRWWLAGGALLLAALAIGWYKIRSAPSATPNGPAVDCPVFRGSGPKVLILPFKNVGQGAAKPEDIIRSRIQIMADKRKFPISAQVLRGLEADLDRTDSEALCRQCRADMVIWGLYDYADSVNIDLRFYTLHDPNGAFTTGFQAFRGLPEIQSGQLLNRLDDAIFGICGILATRAGNAEVARAWFGKMQEKGAAVKQTEQVLNAAE